MLCRSPSLLLRLARHASLVRAALPLLAAYAPKAAVSLARDLHVFARVSAHDPFCKVEVRDGADASDLSDAVCAKLQLPNRVRLLRAAEGGGAPVPLDSRRALAEQGVTEGSSVVVELLPPPSVQVRLRGTSVRTRVVLAPGANADNLAETVIAKLQLGVAPGSVRLLREVEGGDGAPVPLGRHEALDGALVVLDVPPPPLPPPLDFAEEVLGGERTVVAVLQGSPGFATPRPFFLTPTQMLVLEHFLCSKELSDSPSMLVVTGTVKSGKSRIVSDIIPRLLARQHARAAPADAFHRRPVLFHHTFAEGASGAAAADNWLRRLLAFARSLGIPLERPVNATTAEALPEVAAALAARLDARGEELWLLLDEVGAPLVASPAPEAAAFVQLFKDTLAATTLYARTVATGSGMVSLLKAFAVARPSGFTLWGAATHLRVGREPPPAQALAMAQRLHAAYAPTWPASVRAHVTPQLMVSSLAYGAHAGLTSPRPALLAFLARRLRDYDGSAPPEALRKGLSEVLAKLRTESCSDAAVGLERMSLQDRQGLLILATHGVSPTAHPMSDIAELLSEDGEGAAALAEERGEAAAAGAAAAAPALRRLLPPYASLLRRWVRPDGMLCISVSSGTFSLVGRTVKSLVTLQENRASLSAAVVRSVSALVLQAFAERGIGVFDAVPVTGQRALRPPATVSELVSVPAFSFLLAALERAADIAPGKKPSQSAKRFRSAAAAGADAQAEFMAQAGLSVLLLLRNYCGHVSFCVTDEAVRSGITEAAVDYVVQGATAEVLALHGDIFAIGTDGALLRKRG